jgi:flagellar hook-length control protein FliK
MTMPVAATPGAPGHVNLDPIQTVLTAVPHSPALAASTVAQVGFHLQRVTGAEGNQAMTIQLTPEDLGSIEVKLDIGKDGVVHTQVIADRSDTLDMLKSDQRSLERALENAGLNTTGGSLSFDLRGGNDTQYGNGNGRFAENGSVDTAEDLNIAIVAQPAAAADGRVDVTV